MTTASELAGLGRELRRSVPRSSHGQWTAPRDRRDPIEVLEAQATSRVEELTPFRHGRMAESPFAFFRGGAGIMSMDLASTTSTGLTVQACGDAHVSNFGEFATPEGNIVFDVNDFDETLPGPWEWDVKRLCASLAVVGHQLGLARGDQDRVVLSAAKTYRERMAQFASMRVLDLWYHSIDVNDVIAHFPRRYRPLVRRDLSKARKKVHARAVERLTVDTADGPRFIDNPPLIVRFEDTEFDPAEAMSMMDNYRLTLSEDRHALLDRFTMVDVARKAVGVGSVGTHCWIALFEGPMHSEGNWMVLQVKEAQASVLEAHVGESAFDHHGRRVVAGQRLTQGSSDIFLGWTQGPLSGRHYYVRQLWNIKGQGDPLIMELGNLAHYGALCAWALARAHARTGEAAAIAGYLGSSDAFDCSIASFAETYAALNDQDYRVFLDAIDEGRLLAVSES